MMINQTQKNLKVLFCASECNPIVKVGGLGDVVGSLPLALKKLGVDVRIVLPFYKEIDTERFLTQRIEKDIPVFFNALSETVNIYETTLPSALPVYLIKNKQFLSSGGVYFGSTAFADSQKEIERFAFFSKAVLEFIKHFKWKADIIHCHDWHTGLVPDLIKLERLDFATVFTIHNLANQGIGDLSLLDDLHVEKGDSPFIDWDSRDQNLDLILQGILGAAFISTVSPSYAWEIMTPEFGEGLEWVLKAREGRVLGILNGIDVERFDPRTDPHIVSNYSVGDVFEGKSRNKLPLQNELGLKKQVDKPLIGMVTRIADQKGFALLIPVLEDILKLGFQFILLGLGDKTYQERIKAVCDRNSGSGTAIYKFDANLAQRIYAGADIFLMPSRFEPCGLGQMIAMRYGTIPVVRKVGGLKDSVKDGLTGIVFSDYNERALLKAIAKASQLYQNKSLWQTMVVNAMKEDFSWDRSAKEYIKMYERVLES